MARKVAVVEDEEALASLIEYNLTHNGFQVQLVNGSGPTMQDLETGQPDLILLDVMLPALDGFDVCRLIRKSEKLSRTPVIFLTAVFYEIDRRLGPEIGQHDSLTTP